MAYVLSPRLRKAALTVHITVSVGWVGAVVAYLALDITVLTGQAPHTVFAAYVARGILGWYVIVPLAIASFVTGVLMGLGTRWGLFRHYWVVISLLLTLVALGVLLGQVEHFTYAMNVTPDQVIPSGNAQRRRGRSLLHSGGGLLVLFVITALNVYKPRGLTPYGWRRQQEAQTESKA